MRSGVIADGAADRTATADGRELLPQPSWLPSSSPAGLPSPSPREKAEPAPEVTPSRFTIAEAMGGFPPKGRRL